jgi:uncharacterized protein YggT (Ycf19 family)
VCTHGKDPKSADSNYNILHSFTDWLASPITNGGAIILVVIIFSLCSWHLDGTENLLIEYMVGPIGKRLLKLFRGR